VYNLQEEGNKNLMQENIFTYVAVNSAFNCRRCDIEQIVCVRLSVHKLKHSLIS
jgi:hypothetical protein